jgi:cytochrome c biogenesis protein CcdA/glutaredoxin
MINKLIKVLLLIAFVSFSFTTTLANNEFQSSNVTSSNISLNSEYIDIVSLVTQAELKDNVINIYQFYSNTCPHCEKEYEFILELEKKYGSSINLIRYEVTKNVANGFYLQEVGKSLGIDSISSVPFLVIGDQYISGYSSDTTTGKEIDNVIDYYMGNADLARTYNLPLLGEIEAKTASIGFIAVVLGIVDGFNPCAMWVLLFLINMLLGTKDRKKMFILGFTFLFTSGFVYFLSMLGMNFILSFTQVVYIRIIIGLFAVIFGIINMYNYQKEKKKDDGCTVIDSKKRKSMFKRINESIKEPHILIAMAGIIILAAGVNLVELACSLGFPAIFAELLAINEITGSLRILYLVVYVIFYMIDDMIIFTIAMKTLSATGISTKYTKYSHLIGGTMMLIIGLLLIFRPELVMFNF